MGTGGVFFDLLAETADVDGQGVAVAVFSPEAFVELVAGEDLAGVLGEEVEQLEFAGGEGHGGAVDPDLVGADVDGEAAEVEGGRGCLLAAAGAAEDGFDAGDDFAGGGGLDDLFIGAETETSDFVAVLLFGAEDEDGDVAELADAADDLETGLAGHHHVEEDDVDRLVAEDVEGGGAFEGGHDGVALGFQEVAHEVDDVFLIVDDEDGCW